MSSFFLKTHKNMSKKYVVINGNDYLLLYENGQQFKFLIVSENFRTNPLSRKSGGVDVLVVQHNKPGFVYTNVKNFAAYKLSCESNSNVKFVKNLGPTHY